MEGKLYRHRLGEMALSTKHEEMTQNCSHPWKSLVCWHALVILALVSRDRRIPGVYWPTSLVKTMSSRFTERSCLKK